MRILPHDILEIEGQGFTLVRQALDYIETIGGKEQYYCLDQLGERIMQVTDIADQALEEVWEFVQANRSWESAMSQRDFDRVWKPIQTRITEYRSQRA